MITKEAGAWAADTFEFGASESSREPGRWYVYGADGDGILECCDTARGEGHSSEQIARYVAALLNGVARRVRAERGGA
jgi:hypothetical protein